MIPRRTALRAGCASTLFLALAATVVAAGDDDFAALEQLREPDQRVTLSFKQTETAKVLGAVGAATGLEIEYVGPQPSRRIDLDMPDTTVRQALITIAGQAGVSYEMPDGETLRVLSEPFLAGRHGVTAPRLILASKVKPDYPEAERKAGVEGRVILQAVIHNDGTVGSIEVLQTESDAPALAEAAVKAVKQWRYEPATRYGQPVAVYFTVVIQFSLQKETA